MGTNESSARHMELWQELVGTYGALFASIVEALRHDLIGVHYHFQNNERFRELAIQSIPDAQKVYWTEVLYRAHWRSAVTVVRQGKWLSSSAEMLESQNYLGFAACLRGLVESSADAIHGLGGMPMTMSEQRVQIEKSLAGWGAEFVISSETEDRLIHFLYARKIKKSEDAPASHFAEFMKTYLSAAEAKGESHITRCYDELCQIAHPAADSHLWMSVHFGSEVTFTGGEDGKQIGKLIGRHREALQDLFAMSMNSALLTLWVLNRFPVNLFTRSVEPLSFDHVPAWNKIVAAWG